MLVNMCVCVCICAYKILCVRSHNPIFSEYAVDFDVLLEQFNGESERNILQIQSTLPPPPESASYLDVGLIVGVVVVLIVVVIAILSLPLVIFAIVRSRGLKSKR